MLYDDLYEDDNEILISEEKELHEVSRNGRLDRVQQLIEHKVNVNAMDEKERSPLHLAAGQGHIDVITALLAAGAKFDMGDIYGMNAFLWASWFGKVDVMKLLLEKGATKTSENKQGLTAVHCAATRGNMEVLQYLVREVFPEEGFTDEDGLLESVSGKVSDLLGGAGKFIGFGKKNNDSSSSLFKEKLRPESSPLENTAGKLSPGPVSEEGNSAPGVAVKGFSTTVIMKLGILMGKTDTPNVTTIVNTKPKIEEKKTAVDCRPPTSFFERATNSEQPTRILDQTETLVDNTRSFNMGKKTALHLAAEQGHIQALEYLIKAKCNKYAVTGDGSTAMHLAAGTGRRDIVLKLLEKKLNINSKNSNGKTPLHLASECNQADMVELLLSNGADGNITAEKEMAAIHLASKENHCDVISAISRFDTDINAVCEGGNTALHLAAFLGKLEAVNVLLSCGANINCVNAKNRTPLHEVTENGFTDIVEILLIEGASVDVVDKLGKTALLMAIRAENITITDMIIKAERYNEKPRRRGVDGKQKVRTFRHERTPQQIQMKPFCYDLAMNELEENDLKLLFFHWHFKDIHIKAIESQYIGDKSWREHAYRVLLIWLHGIDENPLKILYETLVDAGRKKLADKLRKRANKLARQNNGDCILS